MTFHNKPQSVQKAAMHLLDSAGYYTKEAGDPLELLAKKFGDHVSTVLAKLGATNDELAAMKAKEAAFQEQLSEFGQKLARAPKYDGGTLEGLYTPASIGEVFVGSDEFKTFIADGRHQSRNARLDLKIKANLTSATTNAAGSVGGGAAQAYRDGLMFLPRRAVRVRDLLPVIKIESGSAEVPIQNGRTNNAAMVAEGTAKPQSDIQFTLQNFPARVIAHFMKASRQILDDFPQLQGVIDTELTYGLTLKEDAQLLSGDNTGQNLYGMIPQATAYNAATLVQADLNIIDVVGIAALQMALSDYAADGVILNPADVMSMRMMKDGNGNYILGNPSSNVAPQLFGLPIVYTTAMTARKFLVGQFQTAATIYDRWEARVEIGYDSDDFTKNMVTILGEERLAFAVKQPGALIYGDFDAALAA